MPGNPLDDRHAANRASVRRQFEELWNNGRVEMIGALFDKDFMNFGKQHQGWACAGQAYRPRVARGVP
jgi:hypothetical protein